MSEQEILRRARARAVLNPVPDYTKPPPVFVICNVGGIYMDEAGNPTEGCRPNYEFNKGAIYEHIPGEPTKTFERGSDESVQDFHKRVIGELPAIPESPLTVMFDSPVIRAQAENGPPCNVQETGADCA